MREASPIVVAVALAMAAPLGATCPAVAGAERPNIVLVSIDSLRADHLGCYGYDRDTSPAIDALATGGVLFERAIAQSPWTLPSHASLLTSLYARAHGANAARFQVPATVPTLATALAAAGYATHAVVSGPFMQARFGMARGFDTYDDSLAQGEHRESHEAVTSPALHTRAVALLETATRPFFLFLHYWDVHYDYVPPPPYDTKFDPGYVGTLSPHRFMGNPDIHAGMDRRELRHLVALYDGEIAWVDEHIGRLLEALRRLGIDDQTILVLVADHGDEFFEHGEKGHQHSLYQELLHVPLVLRLPGGPRGRRIAERVELIDVMPTLLEAAGVPTPPGLHGRSLLPLVRGEAWSTRPVFAETSKVRKTRQDRRKTKAWSVHDGRYKLIRYAAERYPAELYDLERDPREQHNVIATAPERATELWAAHEAWQRRVPLASGAAHERLDGKLRERLEALGYLEP
jgi:arylsulfatase A-like enzyme